MIDVLVIASDPDLAAALAAQVRALSLGRVAWRPPGGTGGEGHVALVPAEDATRHGDGVAATAGARPILVLGPAPPDRAWSAVDRPAPAALLARRLAALAAGGLPRIGAHGLDCDRRALVDGDGSVIPLTEKETLILQCLANANGSPVGRDRLLADIFGYVDGVTTRTVETHVSRLRRKLASAGVAAGIIGRAASYALGPAADGSETLDNSVSTRQGDGSDS